VIAVLLDYYAGQGVNKTLHPRNFEPPYPGDRMDNLFWFVQISDLHISKFRDQQRVKDLEEFCSRYIDVIKPVFVLATGDLTDAKEPDLLGSQQYPEEWETYYGILQNSGVTHKTKWLDIRGNHDAFDVPSLKSSKNYFRSYSSSGPDPSRGVASYQVMHRTTFGLYAFNALDMTLHHGTRRPFNFFGHVEEDRVKKMEEFAERSLTANMSIWFGHYTFSTLTRPSLRKLLRNGAVYMCGHLHTLGEVVPKMHAVHPQGHLELELGDWLGPRNYRIAAIDHDLFSFVDVRINTWPIILITNPKDAHYLMPAFEPVGRINMSTHIRMLIFSLDDITSVSVMLDGEFISSEVLHVQGPLFVAKWSPDLYSSGVHTMNVTATDSQGRVNSRVQLFSVDGTRPLLKLLPAFILLTDFCTLGRVVFYLTVLFVVFGLCLFRIANIGNYTGMTRYISTRINALFYPLFCYGVYMIIGPWFIGELIRGHVGSMFVFGIYVEGHWIPGTLTFYYGIVQLLSFNFPITLCLASYLSCPQSPVQAMHRPHILTSHISCQPWCRCVIHVVYLAIIAWQASSCVVIWRAYGAMACLLSPVKLWSLPLAGYLWWKANSQ
ncbi:predicted protein, partial [Nematostella vectensis]